MATTTFHPTTESAGVPDTVDPVAATARQRSPLTRPQWAGVAVLLVATGVLYLWGLSKSGYANSFYSAAVQAGSQSWKAFFFGSLDAGNAITVDKPPASLWLMALSVRIFGLSSWSILAPEALLGVATVGVLYAAVRRTSGHTAGLAAGAVLALTPAAVLMFRFNNPDALLVFLLTAAGYLTLRATEKASAYLMVGVGVLVGFAFLTKMLQAFLVLPAFALVYLVAAPTPVRRRLLHLLAAGAAMIISLGWWVAIVELVPASWRPYVGGSQNNSILDLVFGYNGLARILGREAGGTGTGGGGTGGGGGSPFGGDPGITRLFDGVIGGMISWLIPAALLLGLVAMIITRRADRTNLVRAAIMLWAGWLVVTALVFSFMAGTFHEYYTVALAPAVAGLFAVAGQVLWQRRATWPARIGLAAAMIISAVWAYELLGQATTAPFTSLRLPVLVVGILAAAGLLLAHRLPRLLACGVLGLGLVGAGAGPAAYALNTAATPHQGSIVTAGPVQGTGFGGPGRLNRAGTGQSGQVTQRQVPQGQLPAGGAPQGGTGFGDGEGASTNSALPDLLVGSGSGYRWAAATTGSQSAAGYQLASGQPVMAIGGFSGGDPSPTLAQFQSYVADGQIHYYVSGGSRRGPGRGDGSATQISTWVLVHFTATTVGGATVYDLTQPR